MKMKLPDLRIGDLIINPPIIQGGMGVRVSLSSLASAVANEGGVGVISCALIGGVKSHRSIAEHQQADTIVLTEEIKKARSKSKGVLGVNIMVALTNYINLVKTAVEEGIDIIISGAGLPLSLPDFVKGKKTKIIPIVSSARAAEVIVKVWKTKYNRLPDAVLVEGPMAGGHLGFNFEDMINGTAQKLEDILVSVVETIAKIEKQYGQKIPVIAAGGVYSHKDILKMLELGASGVQIASRFVCTHECDVAKEFKQAYIDSNIDDIVIIKSPVGLPGRALKNEFLEKAKRGEIKFNCYYKCLKTCTPSKSPYCIAEALINAANGDINNGFVFVGSNAYKVNKIVSVKELMHELATGEE